MGRPTLTRRLGVASLLASLSVLTACAGSDGGAPGDAPARAQDAPPAEELEELGSAEFYPAVVEALQEAETFAFASSTTSEDAATPATSIEGVMRYDDEGVDLRASSTGPQPLEMLVVDRVLYLQGEGLDLGEKSWLKVDLDEESESLFGFLAKATDPELLFRAMAEPRRFALVGPEQVDGVATHHYDVVVDTAAYAEAIELPAFMAEYLPEEIGIQMWVDGDNRPRRFLQQIETTIPGGSSGAATATSTTEGTYSDYGLEVELEAPPAAEVTEDAALTGLAG